MTVRFLADEDLNAGIVEGLRCLEPAIDILDVKTSGLRGTKDPDLLDVAVQQDRVLITHDRHTMTRHFREHPGEGRVKPSRTVHRSPALCDRRDHRVASARVDCIGPGGVAQSNRVSASSVS